MSAILDRVHGWLELNGQPATQQQIARGMRVSDRAVREALTELSAAGRVVRVQEPSPQQKTGLWTAASKAAAATSRRVKPSGRGPSQCDLLLAVLADGRPHRMEDIHQRIGFCRLNSRVAELRSRGHDISCDKTGRVYTYQLHGSVSLREASVSGPTDASLNGIGVQLSLGQVA